MLQDVLVRVTSYARSVAAEHDPPFLVGSVVLEAPRKQLVNAPLSSEPPPSRIENKVASLQMSVHPSFFMHLDYANVSKEFRGYDGRVIFTQNPRLSLASVRH